MDRINPQRILDVGSSTHRVELPGVDKAHSVAARTFKQGSIQHRLHQLGEVFGRRWVQVSSEDKTLIFLNINSLTKRTAIMPAETKRSDFPRIFLEYAKGAASLHKTLGQARILGIVTESGQRVILSERQLGKGTFKTVMLGVVMTQERTAPVALQYFNTPKARADFVRENEIAKLFKDSRHVLNPSRFGPDGIVMAEPYLLQWIEMSSRDQCKAILDVAKGIQYMHDKGYAHSDIKPDNFLFRRTDQGVEGVVADFGGVQGRGSWATTYTLAFVPDNWNRLASATNDRYAFGISLQQMFPHNEGIKNLGRELCSGKISSMEELIRRLPS